jgi:hypothetical protein
MTGWQVATNNKTKSKTSDVLSSAFLWPYDCRCRRCGDGSSCCFLNLTQPLNWRLEDSRSIFGAVVTPERLAQCSCRSTNTPYVEMQLLQHNKLALYRCMYLESWMGDTLLLALTWEFLEVGCSGMADTHSKIAQYNWECVGRLTLPCYTKEHCSLWRSPGLARLSFWSD